MFFVKIIAQVSLLVLGHVYLVTEISFYFLGYPILQYYLSILQLCMDFNYGVSVMNGCNITVD